MKKTNEWISIPGGDDTGFIGAFTAQAGPGQTKVPVIFHAPGTCPPESVVLRADHSITLEERTHITVAVTFMNRLMDIKEPIDPHNGAPLDKEKRLEWEAMCDALKAGEFGEDPRIWPCMDLVHAEGRLAKAEDPVTGAKSNHLALFPVGNVNIKIPYRGWYPSYSERLDRVFKNSAMSVDVLVGYMLSPVEEYKHIFS